jgi:hypothetical protein
MSNIVPLRWSKAQREVPLNEQGRLSRRPCRLVTGDGSRHEATLPLKVLGDSVARGSCTASLTTGLTTEVQV